MKIDIDLDVIISLHSAIDTIHDLMQEVLNEKLTELSEMDSEKAEELYGYNGEGISYDEDIFDEAYSKLESDPDYNFIEDNVKEYLKSNKSGLVYLFNDRWLESDLDEFFGD